MNIRDLVFITDMALGCSEFVERAENILRPVTVHLCLILLCKDSRDVPHWKSEIDTFVSQIIELSIKGSNSVSLREKALNKALDNIDLYLLKPKYAWCRPKFKAEGISLSIQELDTINLLVNLRIQDLIPIIASADYEALDKWLDTLV